MSLSNTIRRAASRVVPVVIRFSAGSRRVLHHRLTSAVFAAVNQPSRSLLRRPFPSLVHHYSTRPESDKSLLGVLESEIQCAEESHHEQETEEAPQGFPFKIEDHPGQQTITLTREYQGESITVEVNMPDLFTNEENDNDNDDDEGTLSGGQSSISLVVKVSKDSGHSLEFGCTASPDEVSVDSLSIKDPKNDEDQLAYEGPDFADLDENLQKAFQKYLEMRGIKPSTTNFLHSYMVNKDSREYISWLKNLQKFVEA